MATTRPNVGAKPRLATPADLDLLVRHRRGMWEDMGGYSAGDLDAADPVYRRWARARLRSGTLVGWIVEARRQPVASGCVWVQRIHPRPLWAAQRQPYLMSMYTEPAHRGHGHARRILAAATAWVRRQGYPRFVLHASDFGRPVYERAGWERTWEMKLEF